MSQERFKIVGEIDGKKVTLKTVNDECEAEEERTRFAKSFSSSWSIRIERSTEEI